MYYYNPTDSYLYYILRTHRISLFLHEAEKKPALVFEVCVGIFKKKLL